MSEDLILETGEEPQEILESEDDLPAHISNLSMALGSLQEVDGGLLSKKRQAKLARMKRQIFDALAYYCDCLPEIIEETKEDD